MNDKTFLLLYKSMVCPHVEFANSLWCPFKVGNKEEIEKIQKRATKLIIKLKHKPAKERLINASKSDYFKIQTSFTVGWAAGRASGL